MGGARPYERGAGALAPLVRLGKGFDKGLCKPHFSFVETIDPKIIFFYETEYFSSKVFSIIYWWCWQRLPPKVSPPFPSLFMTFCPISPLSTSSSLDPFSFDSEHDRFPP